MKPSLALGTRDFGPEIVRKRQYILNTIRNVFELYGFQPLETPAFENLETLMGKYGEEGDKLIFKILNNGLERPEKHESAKLSFDKVLQGKSVKELTERALKYDLTIPFARYVAMNQGQLTFPFKRYQIQPVWRADKPQRGRYREFVQCDADIVGSSALFNEKELIQLYLDVFKLLNVPIELAINHRKVLAGIATYCDAEDKLIDITVAIDKLDKIGLEKVKEELVQRGLSTNSIDKICVCLFMDGTNSVDTVVKKYNLEHVDLTDDRIKKVLNLLNQFDLENIQIGIEGCLDMLEIISIQPSEVKLDFTLARGLNYYTGAIIEVKPIGVKIGSIGGGGRYDDLTGLFGVQGIPGVGISFGVDRIYDVIEELNLFPESLQTGLSVMLVNFGPAFETRNREILNHLRSSNISCELYPEAVKFDKQLKYANKRNVGFVIMIGENELQENLITIKNFSTGQQAKLSLQELNAFII